MSYEEVESESSSSACERCGFFPCDCSDPGRVDPWTGEAGPSTREQVEAFLPEKLFVTDHQPEEEEQPFVPTEAEKDVACSGGTCTHPHHVQWRKDRMAWMATQGVAPKASKRPRSPPAPRKSARLDQFFDEYDTPLAQRVTMCRAYASFVASTLPKKAKK